MFPNIFPKYNSTNWQISPILFLTFQSKYQHSKLDPTALQYSLRCFDMPHPSRNVLAFQSIVRQSSKNILYFEHVTNLYKSPSRFPDFETRPNFTNRPMQNVLMFYEVPFQKRRKMFVFKLIRNFKQIFQCCLYLKNPNSSRNA